MLSYDDRVVLQDHNVEAAMLTKTTDLRTRLLSLPSAAVPSLDDARAIATFLRGAERRAAVVSSACGLVVSLCDRGDPATDVETREVLGTGGVVLVLMEMVRAWMATPDLVWHCVYALSAICGG